MHVSSPHAGSGHDVKVSFGIPALEDGEAVFVDLLPLLASLLHLLVVVWHVDLPAPGGRGEREYHELEQHGVDQCAPTRVGRSIDGEWKLLAARRLPDSPWL